MLSTLWGACLPSSGMASARQRFDLAAVHPFCACTPGEVLGWPCAGGRGGITPPWTPPPGQRDHRGQKRKLHRGKVCWAILGTQTFGSQTPPPAPPSNSSLSPPPLLRSKRRLWPSNTRRRLSTWGMPCTQCEVLDPSALRISTFTNKVRHSRITHNPHSFIAFVHLPCGLGLKGLQGIPTPLTGDRYSWVSIPASTCAVPTQCKSVALGTMIIGGGLPKPPRQPPGTSVDTRACPPPGLAPSGRPGSPARHRLLLSFQRGMSPIPIKGAADGG